MVFRLFWIYYLKQNHYLWLGCFYIIYPNIQNRYRGTPLINASRKGYIDIVKLLLENGADPNIGIGDTVYPYDKTRNRDINNLIQKHIDLQKMQRPLQNLAFMKYFLDRDKLDIDTASKIFSNERSYNPGVQSRMMLEDKQRGRGKRSKKRSSKKLSKRKLWFKKKVIWIISNDREKFRVWGLAPWVVRNS